MTVLWALRTGLDSWSGIGHAAVVMHRQGYDLQLTRDVLHERNGAQPGEYVRHELGENSELPRAQACRKEADCMKRIEIPQTPGEWNEREKDHLPGHLDMEILSEASVN
jgi:hypothetical protein